MIQIIQLKHFKQVGVKYIEYLHTVFCPRKGFSAKSLLCDHRKWLRINQSDLFIYHFIVWKQKLIRKRSIVDHRKAALILMRYSTHLRHLRWSVFPLLHCNVLESPERIDNVRRFGGADWKYLMSKLFNIWLMVFESLNRDSAISILAENWSHLGHYILNYLNFMLIND